MKDTYDYLSAILIHFCVTCIESGRYLHIIMSAHMYKLFCGREKIYRRFTYLFG